jgi:hypothetical protein
MAVRLSRRLAAGWVAVIAGAVGALSPAGSSAAHAEKESVELLDMFGEICLRRFPKDDIMQKYIKEKAYPALAPDQVRRFLKADPGIGWFRNRTGGGKYIITLEYPPFHACAVRSLYNKTPDYKVALSLFMGIWAANETANMRELPPQAQTLGDQKIMAYLYQIQRTTKNVELIMAIETTYPNGMVEVRLARSIR